MRALVATSLAVPAAAGIVVGVGVTPASAAGACATPGGDGPGGTLSGIVDTYYPGVGSVSAGATSIDVGAPAGAPTPIAAGDLLLVIEMQDADFDHTNTNSYGHGGAPASPASGYTALNATGLYEYVRATSGVVAGAVGIAGLGSGNGLVNAYRSAAATATDGQRTFQVIRVPQYTTATTSSGLTALAWNGAVGGVLALDTSGPLALGGVVSVDGLGFRGAPGIQRGSRVRALRVFADAQGRMNEPLGDREILCVSQFTLYGDTRRGNRPSYVQAAGAEQAEPLYEHFCACAGARRGVFGAHMQVELVNDGPVTLLLEA